MICDYCGCSVDAEEMTEYNDNFFVCFVCLDYLNNR